MMDTTHSIELVAGMLVSRGMDVEQAAQTATEVILAVGRVIAKQPARRVVPQSVFPAEKGIYRYIDMSTAHLSRQTLEWLESTSAEGSVSVDRHLYGYWLYPGERSAIPEMNLPLDLATLLYFVHDRAPDVCWIRLDDAGWEWDLLPIYDHETGD